MSAFKKADIFLLHQIYSDGEIIMVSVRKRIKVYEYCFEIATDENTIHFYTNKVTLRRKLDKLIGEPQKEYKIKRSIVGSCWDIPLSDKNYSKKRNNY